MSDNTVEVLCWLEPTLSRIFEVMSLPYATKPSTVTSALNFYLFRHYEKKLHVSSGI